MHCGTHSRTAARRSWSLAPIPSAKDTGGVQDKYGVSWQVIFMGERAIRQNITPTLMFVGDVCGKVEEAISRYTSVIRSSKVVGILRYGKGEEPDREGTIKHAGFALEGQEFAAMDSARAHPFTFNEAIFFVVNCETQEEIDYYWEKLSADPKAGRSPAFLRITPARAIRSSLSRRP
jgi:predicted 3-demethylubiquinone-9 3-methyltransferase (glyoxalase superfamily)